MTMQADIDLMRDVYMTNTQRAAYERIRAIAEAAEGLRAWREYVDAFVGEAALGELRKRFAALSTVAP